MGRPSSSDSAREPYVHWIFGDYHEFDFQDLPTEADVIKRFLYLKENRHGNYCTQANKNKIITEIADNLKEKWSDSPNPLINMEAIRKKISVLITTAFENDKKKSYYKNTPNFIERQREKHNTCFDISSSKRMIDVEEAENKREKLEEDMVSLLLAVLFYNFCLTLNNILMFF